MKPFSINTGWINQAVAQILRGERDRIRNGRVTISRTRAGVRIDINLKEAKAHGKAG